MIKRILTALAIVVIPACSALSGLTDHPAFAAGTVASSNSPDLIIEAITWTPANPAMGEAVTFTITIKNQGSDTAASSRVAYYIDDALLNSAFVNQIAPGGTATKNFTWTAQAGSHTVRAVADSNNTVAESDETNNAKTYAFSTLAPDLVIESITWLPENPSKGDSVSFNVKVKNQGNGQANSSRVYFYIDGASRGYQETGRLDAGAATTRTFTWPAQAGSHEIKAIADKDGWVAESDESNNEKTVTFTTSAPDLIIETITWSPESPQESDNVTFTVFIKNQGSGKADYSLVAYYINDRYLSSVSVDPIDAGATDNKTFIWIVEAGSHDIRAVADSSNNVAEGDEANNETTAIFSPLPADLIVQEITWVPESPAAGNTVTFSVTIKNQGSGKAGSSRVYLYLDDYSIGYQVIQQISAGSTVQKDFTWTADAGSHTIRAVADKDNKVPESDESNNEKTVSFSPPLPDLIVENITWSPESLSIGDSVTFTVSLKNQGTGKSDFSYVAYYIDGVYLSSAYIDQMSSGNTTSRTFTWTAQNGSHDIKVIADKENRVIESDESNNEKTIIFSTPAPDLIVQNITWPAESQSIGDSVTFTIAIKNQGDMEADFSRLYLYLDGSSAGYLEVEVINAGSVALKDFTWTAQNGPHDIKVIADKENQVTESDESNNEKTVTFPAPDLIVQSISWTPVSPSAGDNVTFTVRIENKSSIKTGFSQLYFYIDDSFIGYQSVEELDAGNVVLKNFTWTAEEGSHSLKAIIDKEDQVQESDETNNEKIVPSPAFLPQGPAPETPAAPAPGSGLQEVKVSLSGQTTEVIVGQDIILNLAADNPAANPAVTIQLTIEVPPGMSVTSTGFAGGEGGQYTASYDVGPGDIRQIKVPVKTERAGNFDIAGNLSYYFVGDNSTAQFQAILLPVTVKSTDATAVMPSPAPSGKGIGLTWWFILAFLVVGGLFVMAIRKAR